jgi:hypothetical protein
MTAKLPLYQRISPDFTVKFVSGSAVSLEISADFVTLSSKFSLASLVRRQLDLATLAQ